MPETSQEVTITSSDPVPPHDHAWRRIRSSDASQPEGTYRCDLCSAVWAL